MRTRSVAALALGVLTMWTGTAWAQEVGGAGMGLRLREGEFVVEVVAPGGPADRAGVRPGDVLLAVDDDDTDGLMLDEVVAMIRGPVGSRLGLTLARGDDEHDVTLTRAALGAPPAPAPAPPGPPPVRAAPPPPDHNNAGAPRPARPDDAPAPATGRVKLVRQVINDPQVDNRPAFEFLLPEGWQARGGIVWDHNTSMLATVQVQLSDPASGAAVTWLPTSHFAFHSNAPVHTPVGSNWLGQTFLPPVTDPHQFVQTYWAGGNGGALAHLRGARPVTVEDRPAVAQEYLRGFDGWRAQASRVRYAYEQDGRAWEEDVYLVLNYAPQVDRQLFTWNVQGAIACRAPRGELDRRGGLFKALTTNAAVTPEWAATYQVCREMFRNRVRGAIADAARFGQQLREYNDHIAKLGQQIHEERMRSRDRISEAQREYLGGVETYHDPHQHRSFYMPAGYKQYWTNQRGEYLLSDDPTFNPNAGDTADWRQMERRDPMRQ
ncbi:MAG TPA: PDZ domain-containing protein [Tepidisphaeraceae bacterium]|nr:PDZ domain-containing protein [Tepidisphaeraceae bacterium]